MGQVALPVIAPRAIHRDADRRIALGSLVVGAGFVAAGISAALLDPRAGIGWPALHLLLAGGAGTAIAGVLPFFAAALAAGPPADPGRRTLAVVLVATGALAVTSRAVPGMVASPLAPLGGVAFLAGMGLLGGVTLEASRRGMVARRPLVALAYAAAIVNVLVGVSIGTLAAAGAPVVLRSWGLLRPAHAWLNVVGFVSLVIVGTLLHLLPTVAGARIVERWSGRVAVGGLFVGPPLVAAGLAIAAGGGASGLADAVVRAGALATLLAALGLGAEAVAVFGARGRWTTDPGWHLMATGSLAAGIAWFVLGIGLAGVGAMIVGARPEAWSTQSVAAPLAVGWVGQVLIGSWTHLLPAIGPGGPAGHARRRRVLGRAAWPRLVAMNLGVVLVVVGSSLGASSMAVAGLALAGTSVLAGVGLGLGTLVAGRVRPR